MQDPQMEKPALLIIDMLKDVFKESHNYPITPHAKKVVDPINRLIKGFRAKGWPIVFSNDAYHEDDFIFKGRMNPHAIAGTTGAEVIDELDFKEQDYWLPKPRFSAFFQTGLENWLHEREITLCAVAGIATHFCVITTVMDAICHDFKVVMLEDCCAAFTEEVHRQTLNSYRRNPLYPLLRVSTSNELYDELGLMIAE